jgi:hypothetical protein
MSDEPLTLCRHIPKVRRKSLKFFIDRLALRYSGARAIPIDGRLTPFAIGNLAK